MIGRTMHICPRCQRRYTAPSDAVDFEHKCDSGDATLDNEDVPKLGTYIDDNGNTIQVRNAFLQGAQNDLWGTRAGIEGVDSEELTRRGVKKSTHRTRNHYEFIKIKKWKEEVNL